MSVDWDQVLNKYGTYWASHKSGPPTARPLGPHHQQNTQRPMLNELCEAADRVGIQVVLRVSDEVHGKDTPDAHRDIRGLALALDPATDAVGEAVTHGSLNIELAASRLLGKLPEAA